MAALKQIGTSGRDHYAHIYKNELEQEITWLQIGASEKVNSIELLLKQTGISPVSAIELGCGPGAVIVECQRRGLASQFTAVDYSEEALSYLASTAPDVRCIAADITDPRVHFPGEFDVVILSHVLEHLEDPGSFLQSVISKIHFDHLIAEIPLEDLWASRVKNIFRDRERNPAGHVQFFTQASFRRLITSVGLEIEDKRIYVPSMSCASIDFLSTKNGVSPGRRMFNKAIGVYLPRVFGPLWTRLYYAHMAVICRRATSVLNSDV
jgi:hypothetical protein